MGPENLSKRAIMAKEISIEISEYTKQRISPLINITENTELVFVAAIFLVIYKTGNFSHFRLNIYQENLRKIYDTKTLLGMDFNPAVTFIDVLYKFKSLKFQTDLEMDYEGPSYSFSLSSFQDTQLKIAVNEQSANLAIFENLSIYINTLLEAIIAKPEQSIYSLELLPENEKNKILIEWNSTEINYNCELPVHDLFEFQARQTPDRIAVECSDSYYTYKELNEKSNQLAQQLIKSGADKGDLIAICLERSFELIVSTLAVMKAGCAYVPLDGSYPRARLEFILADTNAAILITTAKHKTLFEDYKGHIIDVESLEMQDTTKTNLSSVSLEDIAYVIYTSGSTGKPKGVCNTHKGLLNRLLWMQAEYGLSEDDRVLHKTSYSFDVSVWELLLPIIVGARLVMLPPGMQREPEKLIEFIKTKKISVLHFVPSMLNIFLSTRNVAECSTLRLVFASGEALSYELQQQFFQKLNAKLHNLYGPTEASIDVTYWECQPDSDCHIIPIGKPIANTQIYILDKFGMPMPIGIEGEIHIGGIGLAKGYLNNEKLTNEKFVTNYFTDFESKYLYKTGDRGRFLPDGNIEYLGRIDNQVKIRGYRIELGEIEYALKSHEQVSNAVVVVNDELAEHQRLIAYIVKNDSLSIAKYVREHEESNTLYWAALYDNLYSQEHEGNDKAFNISGWNSSYSNKPFAQDEMVEWIDNAVTRIKALNPKNVLEIGCGTGLLLCRIAPLCESYVGTDISQESISYVNNIKKNENLAHVTLLNRAADNFLDLPRNFYDVIIINSVVQYFTSIEYLEKVIANSLKVLAPGGCIYLGDIRNHRLLRTYHEFVTTYNYPESINTDSFAEKVDKSLLHERELTLSPAYFANLCKQFPQIMHCKVELKYGKFINELTQFRYDVTLDTRIDTVAAEIVWFDYSAELGSYENLKNFLANTKNLLFGVRKIPNTRLSVIRDEPVILDNSEINLEKISQLALQYGFKLETSWYENYACGAYDIVFAKISQDNSSQINLFNNNVVSSEKDIFNKPWSKAVEKNLISNIQAHLKQLLPDFMVPHSFLFLNEIPLTISGKIDRKALPSPGAIYTSRDNSSQPLSTAEDILESILKKLLAIDDVNVDDNFFEIGGDSIVNIQFVSQARDHGIFIDANQIYKTPTIAGILATGMTARPQHKMINVPEKTSITPIQHWFFSQNLVNKNYWNQSVLLKPNQRLEPNILNEAIVDIISMHDVFRSYFKYEGEWRQIYNDPQSYFENKGHSFLIDISLDHITEAEQYSFIEDTRHKLSASLNIETGELYKFVLFHSKSQQYLFIVIHHLLIDGLSWRILLENLEVAYFSILNNERKLPLQPSINFQEWAYVLVNHAKVISNSDTPYWLNTCPAKKNLPIDFNLGINSIESSETITLKLNEKLTNQLLHHIPRTYQVQINDILLTALLKTICDWTKEDSAYLALEGHGREQLEDCVDISKTIGWFTTLFPAYLTKNNHTNLIDLLQSVKTQLQAIPRKGLSYGIAAYLSDDNNLTSSLMKLGHPDLCFNYLGQWDNTANHSTLFNFLSTPGLDSVGKDNQRAYLIDLNCLVNNKCFEVFWTYSKNHFYNSTIMGLAEAFIFNLKLLIESTTLKDEKLANLYPLSSMQAGLLFSSLYAPDSDVYMVQIILQLEGEVKQHILKEVWHQVAMQHDALRSEFIWDNIAEPSQYVSEVINIPWSWVDLRHFSQAEQVIKIEELCQNDRRNTFDFAQSPLFRIMLIQKTETSYSLIWTHHHILIDGWSIFLILKDVLHFYKMKIQNIFQKNRNILSYVEYLQWLQQQDHAHAEKFWQDYLAGFVEPFYLNNNYYKARSTFETASVSVNLLHCFELDERRTATLKSFAQYHRVSMNTVLQSAWAILLREYSGLDDIVLGMTISGRTINLQGSDSLVGLLINTVPFRVQFLKDYSLTEFLQSIQAQTIQLNKFGFVALSKIQSFCQSLNGNPLFNSIFVSEGYTDVDELNQSAADFSIKKITWQEKTEYPFALSILPGEKLQFQINYDTNCFTANIIETLANRLTTLLASMVDGKSDKISQLTSINQNEYHQLLRFSNHLQIEALPHQSIITAFESQVLITPDAPAATFENHTLTYRELNEKVNQMAHALRSKGVGAEVLVAVSLERSLHLIISLLAILKAGGAYVPLDPGYPKERLNYIISNANAALLIVDSETQKQFSSFQGHHIDIDDFMKSTREYPRTNPSHTIEKQHAAYVIYTSGSTGQPKGVINVHAGLINRLVWMKNHYAITANARILHKTPFGFDVSVWELFLPLISGAELVIAPPGLHKDPDGLIALIKQKHITVMHFVPSMFDIFLANIHVAECISLKQIFCSGEALLCQSQENFFKNFPACELHNLYGPTEASIDVTYWHCQDISELSVVPIGRPITNTQIFILGKQQQLVPIGITGEIYIGGEGLARGYLQQPELTAEKFITNPFLTDADLAVTREHRLYRTGDLGRFLEDGNIEYLGRTDDQIKLRGFRIELGEIEVVLGRYPNLAQVAVIASEHAAGQMRLVAYIVANAPVGEDELIEGLRAYAEEKLPDYMLPSAYVVLAGLPINANGKLDRKSLPTPEQTNYVSTKSYAAPRTEMEVKLCNIWQKVLNLKQVGIKDNFFHLGGDSILSIQLTSRIRQLGIHFEVSAVFKYPTIESLIKNILSIEEVIPPALPQAVVVGDVPLTPIQHWFFEQNYSNVNHYNQAVLLISKNTLALNQLQLALEALIHHHDGLRLRFMKTKNGWHQKNLDIDKKSGQLLCEAIDLSGLSYDEQISVINRESNRLHATLNIESGPVVQAILFNGMDLQQRLLIVIHHLVIDGISWRILLEDLAATYNSLSNGKSTLPEKTSSFQEWAKFLNCFAKQIPAAEINYWKSIQTKLKKTLLSDFKSENSYFSTSKNIVVSLSEAETSSLLQKTQKIFNSRINDILLTALVLAIGDWTGQYELSLLLEGHGREDLDKKIDLSRTVGWFTSIFPVHLNLWDPKSISHSIKSVKEVLHRIPRHGIGYGIIKYLLGMEDNIEPQLRFNYLGQWDSLLYNHSQFEFAKEAIGEWNDKNNKRDCLIDIVCRVIHGRLEIDFSYSTENYLTGTITQIANNYLNRLKELIAADNSYKDFVNDALINSQENISDAYSISPMQSGLLFNNLYNPKADNYFVQNVFQVEGKLDTDKMHMAWQQALNQYSILRTGFYSEGMESPIQCILRSAKIPWKESDWVHLSHDLQQQSLEITLKQDRENLFNLASPPLLRVHLIRCSPTSHYFILSHHHILMDGWSLFILLKYVFAAYHQKNTQLNLVKPDYKEYINWINRQNIYQAEVFWQGYLQGFNATSYISQNVIAEKNHESTVYGHHQINLSDHLTLQLKSLAKENCLTLNTIIQGAWGILLSRYTRQEDIVFGVTISGRSIDLAGVEDIVGLFINTIPLRLRCDENEEASQYLQRLQITLAELNQYAYLSLAKIQTLVDKSNTVTRHRHNLFDHIFVFENYPINESLINQNNINLSHIKNVERSEYPLTIIVTPKKDLSIQFSYESAHFSKSSIERIANQFKTLLQNLVTNPFAKLSDLSLLSNSERRMLAIEWNKTDETFPPIDSLNQLFEAQAKKTPDSIAVVYQDKYHTYCELNNKANQIAHLLRDKGVGADVRVAVSLGRSFHLVSCLLAILKAGGVYVPLDPGYPIKRLNYILEDTQAPLLIIDSNCPPNAFEYQGEILKIDEIDYLSKDNSTANLPVCAQKNNLAYIIYTSGSTGNPKGVEVTHQAINNSMLARLKHYPDSIKSLLFTFSISFDTAIAALFWPLIGGGKLILYSGIKVDMLEIIKLINTHKVAELMWAQSLQNNFLEVASSTTLPSLERIVIGGEMCKETMINAHAKKLPTVSLYNEYGPTEAAIWISFAKLFDGKTQSLSEYITIGRPIANSKIYLVDQNQNIQPIGMIGEIYIGGENLAKGYLNQPQLTAERFISAKKDKFGYQGKLYRTGDFGRYMSNGNIEYIGRIDDQVKLRGFRIELSEIEICLNQYIDVEQAAVVAREDVPGQIRLIAYIVPVKTIAHEELIQRLCDYAKDRLPDYMQPSAYSSLTSMPLTPNGKLDRKALLGLAVQVDAQKNIYVSPRSEVEEKLSAIWKELLNVDKISMTANFFDLGGHSLLIVSLQLKIKKIFDKDISVVDLFQFSTIEKLGSFLIDSTPDKSQFNKILKRLDKRKAISKISD